MRVMLVIDGLWVGGTERSLAELLTCYRSRDIEPLVVALRRCGSEGVEEEVMKTGIEVLFAPRASALAQTIWLRKMIKRRKPELIHTMLAKADMVGRVAAWRTGIPLICSVVSMPYGTERLRELRLKMWKVRLWQLFDSLTSKIFVTHFHSVSESAKREAVKSLGLQPEKITVVVRGRNEQKMELPSPETKEDLRRMFGLSMDDIVLASVGRCDYVKGHRFLLEAMALLAPECDRLKLIIAGRPGNATKELDELVIMHGLSRRVSFLGHMPQVETLLAASDIFVFPSLYEGLPGAVIEAMALGLPVIASDIGAVREIIEEGKNALLFPLRSSGALSEAMKRLILEPELRERFGKRSREIFLERFRLSESADNMVSFYRNVVESGNK